MILNKKEMPEKVILRATEVRKAVQDQLYFVANYKIQHFIIFSIAIF